MGLSTSISQSTMVGLRFVFLLGFTLYRQVELGPAQYEEAARKFVEDAERQMQEITVRSTFDSWNYESNITEATEKVATKSREESARLTNMLGKEAQKYDISKINDYDVKRKLKLMKNIGTSILPKDKLKAFIDLTTEMGKTFSTAKVLDYKTKSTKFSLEPELSEILANSRDPAELQYYWEEWRAASGQQIREMYGQYVDLYNEAAQLNGFDDASLMKVDPYESDTFKEEMGETWEGLKPLYQQLHAYVRHKLSKFYGSDVVPDSGPIPAHLLGNMWAQSWNNIADILKPFPSKPSINVEAGNKMKEMLSLGASRPWRDAMEKMTGQREMSTGAIREYFQPLESWLTQENEKNGVTVGWGKTDLDQMCHSTEDSLNTQYWKRILGCQGDSC